MYKGKNVIVTGAARGIGKAIAKKYAENEATVFIFDMMGAEDTANELKDKGLNVVGINIDITDYNGVQKKVGEIIKDYGHIDIIVNNAGIIARDEFVDLSYDTWNKVMNVNINGNFNLCKAVIPSMIERKTGKILNITSIAGKMGDITASAAYGTSKGAINTLTRSLARQLAKYNITVNAIAPHAIESDMSAQWSPEKRADVLNGIPLHRMGTPEEIAFASLFLTSEYASFITGEVLNVNGGALMD